ncbi:MAG: DUF979 family protein [Rudaea sp.]|nr:DUF979 family protein [Rudaea sp.]
MLRIEHVYWLCGAILAACAVQDLRARRRAHAAFWGILAACFLGGDGILAATAVGNALPAQMAGAGVIVLALIAGSGRLHRRTIIDPDASLRRANTSGLGNRLFAPALVIPLGTLGLVLLQPWLRFDGLTLIDSHQATLTALALACVLAALAALRLTHARPVTALEETGRLLNALSWAALLPMLLATLGAMFAATGVGEAVAHIMAALIPTDSRLACLLAYAFGMAVFTVIMGNAFAAFPVMTVGIGLPLLIVQHHADAAALGALGMLSGYCGTLLTPMAANYNVVPAALLELRDPNGVIRAQWPTAVFLFTANLLLMNFFAFR